jgi:hypothetical protein
MLGVVVPLLRFFGCRVAWADIRIIPLSFLSLIVVADALLSNG